METFRESLSIMNCRVAVLIVFMVDTLRTNWGEAEIVRFDAA